MAGRAIWGGGASRNRTRGECALELAWHRQEVLGLHVFFGSLSLRVAESAMPRLVIGQFHWSTARQSNRYGTIERIAEFVISRHKNAVSC